MNIYGRTQQSDSELRILSETIVVADSSSLRELASFLYRCADAIEEEGEPWEYAHFESAEAVSQQLVVFNANVVSAEGFPENSE